MQEDDKMHPDPRISSAYKVETDIIELYPMETLWHMLRHVLKCDLDICSAIWHKIDKFSDVEYELQRTTIVNDSDGKDTS